MKLGSCLRQYGGETAAIFAENELFGSTWERETACRSCRAYYYACTCQMAWSVTACLMMFAGADHLYFSAWLQHLLICRTRFAVAVFVVPVTDTRTVCRTTKTTGGCFFTPQSPPARRHPDGSANTSVSTFTQYIV
ncbi:hypothetical protein [Vogesella sp. LIG4]|uniref:hypothetical protein n=1 Tax=Vogesella sp. LIG4 TaxID=1192162 RepID=UPI0012FE1BD6|nr:hypothetical protein [Vogesella sp. LIG4]